MLQITIITITGFIHLDDYSCFFNDVQFIRVPLAILKMLSSISKIG